MHVLLHPVSFVFTIPLAMRNVFIFTGEVAMLKVLASEESFAIFVLSVLRSICFSSLLILALSLSWTKRWLLFSDVL